jgi:acetyl-CoA carboxylase, biotin carboxylase subunit
MFKRILIANRGAIAVRIIRACRDLGIETVAVFEEPDRGAMHVRMADRSRFLTSSLGYMDPQLLIEEALATGADAIHPGCGFLAERPDFVRACEEAGLAFIGPSSEVMATLRCKNEALARARAAGIPTPEHAARSFGPGDWDALQAAANQLGYPLVTKPCAGGRGPGTRTVWTEAGLEETVCGAQAQARAVYGSAAVYLEAAIMPARKIAVQILRDSTGRTVHLGERDGSLQVGTQVLIEESPAPCMSPVVREAVWQMALKLATLFNYTGAGTIEFLLDRGGHVYFTEIKSSLQAEHPVTELVSGIDIVHQQIAIAAGQPLALGQEDVRLKGWAMQCRIDADDVLHGAPPGPWHLRTVRLPGGPQVRVDTCLHNGCELATRYDSNLATVSVWGEDRDECISRMRRALKEFALTGLSTNLSVHRRILENARFAIGDYTCDFLSDPLMDGCENTTYLRDMAVAAAILHAQRATTPMPALPDRRLTKWRLSARRM